MGRDEFGSNVEMEPLTPNGGQFGGQYSDPNQDILNKCEVISKEIDAVKISTEPNKVDVRLIKQLQLSLLNNPNPSAPTMQLDDASKKIMESYQGLAQKIKSLASMPDAGNFSKHIFRVRKKLKEDIREYRMLDAEFRKKLQEQMARQYRIVRPNATDAEVTEAIEDTSQQQVFSQALMQSNRRGQAQSALSAVQSRHDEIQKIERQMIELGKLFQEMEELVIHHDTAVTNIEMKGEEVVDHMDNGNEQLGTAIVSARNARKWKWWCLGIVVLIIAIIVIVVLIYKFVIQNNGTSKTKRFVLPVEERSPIYGTLRIPPQGRSPAPGLAWARDGSLEARAVVPGLEWTGETKREQKFQA